jgi:hypothetical protein
MKVTQWKPPEDAPISTAEFAWDVQLTAVEFAVIKTACREVFESIIQRESDPCKRTILLGRVVQDSGVVLANYSLKYSMGKLVLSTKEE